MFSKIGVITALCVLLTPKTTAAPQPKSQPQSQPKVTNQGPVLPETFPDVNIQWSDGQWWAFATADSATHTHIQVACSTDYKNWYLLRNDDGTQYDALPTLPSWTNKTKPETWGPDVVKLDNGDWIMYWSAHYPKRGSAECNSWAKSTSGTIKGPYAPDTSDEPWLCPPHSNGAFGASGFKDWDVYGDWTVPVDGATSRVSCESKVDGACGNSFMDNAWSEGGHGGKRYVVTKVQNADGSHGKNTKTPLTLYEVDATDGVTLKDNSVVLLDNDGKSDEDSIESPTIFKTPQGKYVLTFSRGNTVSKKYTTSYAVADKLTGPYVRKGDILTSETYGLHSPGAADLSWGGERLVFAAIPHLPFNHTRVFHAGVVDVNPNTGEVTVVSV